MDTSRLHAVEVVALAQMVLSRSFQGPVRGAAAQELLEQAKVALGRGEASLAGELAAMAAKLMRPAEPAEPANQIQGELMADGGSPLPDEPLGGLSPLALREQPVDFRPAPFPPRKLRPRLATDGTPRGLARALKQAL